MRRWMGTILTGVLTAALLLSPAIAAGPEDKQVPSPWAYAALADSYALGLLDDQYGTYIQAPVTTGQVQAMAELVADKLSLLELPVREEKEHEAPLLVDGTREGVMNALYQQAAAYALPGVELGPTAFLSDLGVVHGVGTGDLAPQRPCTYQEAMVMAQRLILALYDRQDAGAKGLLWKATGNGNTLYLLGTIHVERDNAYPLHKSLRQAIAASETVIFELDPNDQAGLQELYDLQTYSDGSTLEDYISPYLYGRVVRTLTTLGMAEEEIAHLKPWVLASRFDQLALQDETTGTNAVAIDTYVSSAAINAGKKIEAVETYAFQGQMFDRLSLQYQEAYLENALTNYEAGLSAGTVTEEDKAAAIENNRVMTAMYDAWKNRDPQAFAAAYSKGAIMNSGDELNEQLFAGRDPGMIDYAAGFLEREKGGTALMAVGAGHMIDPGGVVSGLRALGYQVELVK